VAPPAPVYEAPADAPVSELEPPIEAYEPEPEVAPSWHEPEFERIESHPTESTADFEVPQTFAQPVEDVAEPTPLSAYTDEGLEAEAEPTPLQAYTPQSFEPIEYTPEARETYSPQPTDSLAPASWPVQPPAAFDPAPELVVESEPVFETASAPVFSEPVGDVAPDVSVPAPPSITIFGRVQMTISPVSDFDKLLSLDSALARIAGVHSVTLADYAREEVVFRVELEKPVSVVEFAHQLSDTAGVATEVTEASESTLSIRIS
jgi:hypothetical protein